MLIEEDKFKRIERSLREKGTIQKFEDENGHIRGRMMITLGEVPDGLNISMNNGDVAFIGSFDFYDAQVGVVINPSAKQISSETWINPQVLDAEPPTEEWINYFVKTLMDSLPGDGSYSTPIYSFTTDTSEMTVIPTL